MLLRSADHRLGLRPVTLSALLAAALILLFLMLTTWPAAAQQLPTAVSTDPGHPGHGHALSPFRTTEPEPVMPKLLIVATADTLAEVVNQERVGREPLARYSEALHHPTPQSGTDALAITPTKLLPATVDGLPKR